MIIMLHSHTLKDAQNHIRNRLSELESVRLAASNGTHL